VVTVKEQGQGIKRLVKALGVAESLNQRIGQILSFLFYVMAGIMIFEVIARYIFNSPTIWVYELALFLFAITCLVGGGYVLLQKGHVNVDIFYNRLRPRGRAILDLFSAPFFFFFAVMLLWQGTKLFLNSLSFWEHSTSLWGPPLYPIKLALPIGAALILLQGLVKFIKDIIIATRGEM